MHVPESAPVSIPELRAAVRGRVIGPGEDGYDEARTPFYGGFNAYPALVVRAADAADVAHVVSLARDTGLDLAVRSGGHSAVGHCTTDGGIILDLGDLDAVEVDVEGRSAWVEPGLTAGELTETLAVHGLAVGFGDAGSVGIGGITVGGGVGFLSRKHGLTIDSLLAAEIVTADGGVRLIDANTEPDLFWAIRGGGGNFGVVTRLKFRLHDVGTVVGGILILPATARVIASFIAEADAAPEELSTIANVMVAPPLPFLPEETHGKLVIFALLTYAGEVEAGAQVMARFRALATPLADMLRPMTYPEMFLPEDDSYHPTAVGRTMFIESIDRGVAGTILEYLERSDASLRVAQLRVLGGAIARVPADETAFAHRDSRIMVNVAAFYDGEAERAVREEWVTEFAEALQQQDVGAYVNFLGDEGPERTRAAYPGATWDRLVQLKGRYDPANVFRVNHNIPPG